MASVTKDWQRTSDEMAQILQGYYFDYLQRMRKKNGDDGEFLSDIEEFLIELVEHIEECSNFSADRQLATILHKMKSRPQGADLRSYWIGEPTA